MNIPRSQLQGEETFFITAYKKVYSKMSKRRREANVNGFKMRETLSQKGTKCLFCSWGFSPGMA